MPATARADSPATISAPATLGLLGGGQLGRFFVQAAHELGYSVWVLDPDPASPAGRIADKHLAAAYEDRVALDAMAAGCAAITTEFENVPAPSLEYLARTIRVRPSAAAVAVCQDRIAEKSFLRDQHLPHGPFAVIRSEEDLATAPPVVFPGVLKVARFGYDGKGQARVATREEALAAWRQLGGEACVLEALLPLDCEVSVVLARDAAGVAACFPVAENSHRHGILDVSIVPARISPGLAESARQCALRIAAALDYVGTLGVEFFISRGVLYVNEMAPRPHNSGHYTLDACATSQYEQQVRALCGLPLGNPGVASPAVMVNLLGDLWSAGEPKWSVLLSRPGLKLHLYGKHQARPGRKMGHFTVLGPDLPQLVESALAARAAIGIRD
ncbi:MAG: 5-(carboxyamino)imidazole ribonucleotide synthase [Gammaproteobacteria bacterium]